MKKKIKYRIQSWAQRLGFHIVKFKPLKVVTMPKPQILLKNIEVLNLEKKKELKNLTYYARITDNHTYYDQLLSELISGWNIQYESAEFVGQGGGESSFNTYRKVTIDGIDYFEKVYFNDTDSLKKNLLLDELFYQRLKKEINLPKIKFIKKGKYITAVYYEFLTFETISKDKLESALIDNLLKLRSVSDRMNLSELNFQYDFLKLENKNDYSKKLDKAANKLMKYGIDFNKIEKEVFKMPLVISHGDFHHFNIFSNNKIVDWDNWGLYPLGYDLAIVYFILLINDNIKLKPIDWVRKIYTVFDFEDYSQFRKSFMFFLYVFSVDFILCNNTEIFNNLEDEIIENL